jgi:predicted RNA-binding protein YlxR (DUF448 family)
MSRLKGRGIWLPSECQSNKSKAKQKQTNKQTTFNKYPVNAQHTNAD